MTPNETPHDAAGEALSGSKAAVGDFDRFGTWVDRLIGTDVGLEMVLRAGLFGLVVFGLGFLVAAAGGAGMAYLRSPSALLVGLGILLATLSYGWGSWKFRSVVHEIRAAFDIQDEAYSLVVSNGLATIYDDRAILTEFAFALVAVLGLQLFVPIPVAIPVGEQPLVEIMGTTIRYADIIQHVVGIVVLLYVVTGIHMVSSALRLLYRLSRLPLEAPQVAAIELDDLAEFSAVVATMWFLVVVLMVVVYQPWFGRLFADGTSLMMGPWVTGTAVALLLVGVAIFLVPQVVMHSALVRRKRDQLVALDAELERLLEDLRSGDRDPDSISVALDLHDRRREQVKNTRTWLLDSRRLLHMVSSGIAATVSVVSQVAGLPWI